MPVIGFKENIGQQSAGNSTTTPLTGSATFTGTGEQNSLAQVGVMLKTDAEGTLYFDFSSDGTNWDSTFPVNGFTISANISEFHTAIKLGRYFRVRLVNGTSAQTFLRLATYYGDNFVPSVAPLNQNLSLDTDALSVRPTNFDDEVVIGRRTGVTPWTKFAYASGLTASAGEEVVWTTADPFVPMVTGDTFDITYTNTTDGLGTTGALSLLIYYIDDDGLSASAIHVLGNTGSDTTAFSGLGINRVIVLSSGTNECNANDIHITNTTLGDMQAHVAAETGVTQQAIYFVDSNSDAVARLFWCKINKLSGGSAPRVVVKGYVFSRTTLTRYQVFRELLDAAGDGQTNLIEPIGFKLNPNDVLWFVADTNTNATEIDVRFSAREYKRD